MATRSLRSIPSIQYIIEHRPKLQFFSKMLHALAPEVQVNQSGNLTRVCMITRSPWSIKQTPFIVFMNFESFFLHIRLLAKHESHFEKDKTFVPSLSCQYFMSLALSYADN